MGDKLYIYGGSWAPEPGKYGILGDLWSFDLKTSHWQEISQTIENPGPRLAHRLIPYSESSFLLFGGGLWDSEKNDWVAQYDDIWIYNAISNTWTKIPYGGPKIIGTFSNVFELRGFYFLCGGYNWETRQNNPLVCFDPGTFLFTLTQWRWS